MNLRATLSWGPKSGGWALLWLSNPKSWRLGQWQLRSGSYPKSMTGTELWRYWRVGPLELRRFSK